MMNDETSTLIQTLTKSTSNAVLSYDEIEKIISQRLLTAARYIYYLDSTSSLKQDMLFKIAEENEIYRINIFDRQGIKVLGSHNPESTHGEYPSKYSPLEFIKPILDGKQDELIIGLKSARFEPGKRYAAAKRRSSNRGGAIVLNLDAEYILSFKNKIGVDKMLEEIARQKDIEYALIQDTTETQAKLKSFPGLSKINEDTFLQNAFSSDSVKTRTIDYNSEETFEAVKTLYVNNEKIGLLRIGLSMEGMRALESRMVRRGVILSLILFILAFIVLSAIFINQNLALVSEKYEKIQTYTGNIIENLGDAIITTDKNGDITIFNKNAEKLFETEPPNLVGKNISSIKFNDDNILINSLTSKKSLLNFEAELKTPNNRKKECTISTTFTYDKDNEINSYTAVIKDITELKQMEEHVKRQDKMAAMGELASGVAHEIRNPFNAMSMAAQRIETEFVPGEKTEEYKSLSRLLQSEIKRINQIIVQFLKYAKPPKINLINLKICDLLDDCLKLIESECDSKKIRIKRFCDDSIIIPVDAELLKQALLNLFKNSIEAISSDGEITINCYKETEYLKIKISDNGIGIPKDNLNKIFNLYFTSKASGTGMGLSIVQQIVSQHNGYISVESEEKTGTSFLISLPINKK